MYQDYDVARCQWPEVTSALINFLVANGKKTFLENTQFLVIADKK